MSEVRRLPAVAERVETGPIQFGDDWPGTFIRGDNAAYYAMCLAAMLSGSKDVVARVAMRGLLSDLQSSRVGDSAHAGGK